MGFSVNSKTWLEYNDKPIMGKGRYNLLKNIEKTHSLKESAKLLGISDKTAYNYIKRMEGRLGKKIIESQKGGKNAGGSTILNSLGKELVTRYEGLS